MAWNINANTSASSINVIANPIGEGIQFITVLLFILLFTACSDDCGNNVSSQKFSKREVSSIYELGACNKTNANDSIYVTKENVFYYCDGIEWAKEIEYSSGLTTCDDSSSCNRMPSKAEECASSIGGVVTAECLVGTWSLIGIANANLGEIYPDFNYAAGPGKLIFTDDGKFQFDLPTVSLDASPFLSSQDFPVYGSWHIEGNVIKLHSASVILFKTRVDRIPRIVLEGSEIKMTFGANTLWLMEIAVGETDVKANATEVYTISAD